MTSPAIKCACPTKSGNGGANGISCPCPTKSRGRPKEPHLLELDRHLVRLVEEQKPTNIRSLYYRSVSLGLGPKDEKSPNKSNDACFCLGGMALFLFHRLWTNQEKFMGTMPLMVPMISLRKLCVCTGEITGDITILGLWCSWKSVP